MDFLEDSFGKEERKKVRKIIDSFSKSIGKIKRFESTLLIKPKIGERQEIKKSTIDSNFKILMFQNAPNKTKDFIIAEKRKWK